MTPQEFKEAWEEDYLAEIEDQIDDSWRHGNNHFTVFQHEDGRYFAAEYRVSGDGEYHGIRENDFTFYEVKKVETVVTKTEVTWERLTATKP